MVYFGPDPVFPMAVAAILRPVVHIPCPRAKNSGAALEGEEATSIADAVVVEVVAGGSRCLDLGVAAGLVYIVDVDYPSSGYSTPSSGAPNCS